jgi:hypothetical protein
MTPPIRSIARRTAGSITFHSANNATRPIRNGRERQPRPTGHIRLYSLMRNTYICTMFDKHRFNIPTRSPKVLWREIENEAGPLDQIDIDGMKRTLELALVEATIRGESVVQVPPQIVKRMLADLSAQQRGRSLRPKHRPRKNWWLRRWEQTAVSQLDRRRRELQAEATPSNDAICQAAAEIAGHYLVRPATLISWWANPGRLQRK